MQKTKLFSIRHLAPRKSFDILALYKSDYYYYYYYCPQKCSVFYTSSKHLNITHVLLLLAAKINREDERQYALKACANSHKVGS